MHRQRGYSCAYEGFCPPGTSLHDCALARSMHTIAKSCTNSSDEFGSFTQHSLHLNVWPACRNLPEGGYQHCPQCLDRESDVLSKLSNVCNTSLISEGVNVCIYTFAGESSGVGKLVFNKIEVSVRSKKQNRIEPALLDKCSNTTYLSCFKSLGYKTVPIQIYMVMEVTMKVSESMNMFSGDSSSKNDLIKLFLEDQLTNESAYPLLLFFWVGFCC